MGRRNSYRSRRSRETTLIATEVNSYENNGAVDPESDYVPLLDVYETRQKYGYCSIIFSIIQTIILIAMMVECGVTNLSINPMIGPPPDTLDYWGGKNSYKILQDNEFWRLITPTFLHGGVIHLIGNISVQIDMGVFFECEWGSLNWFIIYMFSNFGAFILSVCIMPTAISVGSSGGIMGLLGGKVAELVCRCCEPTSGTLQQRINYEVRKHHIMLCIGGIILVMAMSFLPYVDWAAHLGGLIAGFVVGCVVFPITYMNFTLCRIIWSLLGLSLTITVFTVALVYMYSNVEPVEELQDVCGYYEQAFENYECSTCSIYAEENENN